MFPLAADSFEMPCHALERDQNASEIVKNLVYRIAAQLTSQCFDIKSNTSFGV